MRFGKEFVSKMIPEWQETYIDYAYLKTILQDIQTSRNISVSNNQMKTSFARNLTRRYNCDASVSESHDIVVNTVTHAANESGMIYQTAFSKAGELGGDTEVVFFRTLDQEFNKVNRFYRSEVEKARDEALALNKQMDALVAFRLRVMEKKHSLSDSFFVDINAFTSEIGSSSKSKEHTNQSVLERIRMNKTRETPLSTIKTILKVHKHEEELRFTRENLKKAEKLLQIAFIEFYQKLGHLKNYSFLNTSAISKIIKKYDKLINKRQNGKMLYFEPQPRPRPPLSRERSLRSSCSGRGLHMSRTWPAKRPGRIWRDTAAACLHPRWLPAVMSFTSQLPYVAAAACEISWVVSSSHTRDQLLPAMLVRSNQAPLPRKDMRELASSSSWVCPITIQSPESIVRVVVVSISLSHEPPRIYRFKLAFKFLASARRHQSQPPHIVVVELELVLHRRLSSAKLSTVAQAA
ncbi:hypothetical protein F2Q70_00033046 [Brassica cretica]|uniref:SPX domain-containing protein n=2 Tax=Brassica cretica TaxID=69181 RepID=A0A8S9FNI2_BRACR|nr:hypothetical protein F2Q70_00033046 [Brassica cretica]